MLHKNFSAGDNLPMFDFVETEMISNLKAVSDLNSNNIVRPKTENSC